MLPKLIQELQALEAAYNSLVNPDSAISGKVTELVKALAQDVTAIKASLHDMADRLEAVEVLTHPANTVTPEGDKGPDFSVQTK